MISRTLLLGAAIGVGAVLLVPGVAAAVARAGKPIMRSAIRTGAVAYDEARRAGAEVYEHLEDVAAEVQAELDAEADVEMEAAADER